MSTRIYCDGVEHAEQLKSLLQTYPCIKGFTTNPSLMRKAGVEQYEPWAKELLAVTTLPISLEVIGDTFTEMARQARLLASWGCWGPVVHGEEQGGNVYVKIPVMTTKGAPTYSIIERLSHEGIKLNVTAVMDPMQVLEVRNALRGGAPSYISVFAGRIADTGRDPVPIMRDALLYVGNVAEVIWASPREVLNVVQAEKVRCPIITVPPDMLPKLTLRGKDLAEYSLETVRMFRHDAVKAGYEL